MANYGLVSLIFVRDVSDPLVSLIKSIDKQIEAHSLPRRGREKPGVHVVFCSDDPNLKPKLEALIAREQIKHVVLSIARDKAQGPKRYKVALDAEITIAIYKDQDVVVANHVLESIDLTVDRCEEILKGIRKVLP